MEGKAPDRRGEGDPSKYAPGSADRGAEDRDEEGVVREWYLDKPEGTKEVSWARGPLVAEMSTGDKIAPEHNLQELISDQPDLAWPPLWHETLRDTSGLALIHNNHHVPLTTYTHALINVLSSLLLVSPA